MIYAQQANRVPLNNDNLKQFAADLGLDQTAFNECLESGKYTQFVQQQSALANQIGVNSTPAFLINAQAILGAQPFDSFRQVIEGLLDQ